MAKSKEPIVPFFKASREIERTFEALRNELMMTISFFDTCIALDGVTPESKIPKPMREQMDQRAAALRAVCMDET